MTRKMSLMVVLFLFVVSCAGIGVKLSDNAVTVLQAEATSTLSYMIAKNNKQYIPKIKEWYSIYEKVQTVEEAQKAFKDGMAKLSDMIAGDPFLSLQIQNAMNLLDISVEGPQIESDLKKYKSVVDSFMLGVLQAEKA